MTSTTDAEARNMGRPGIAPKDERYDQADLVVAEVIDLMRTWDDGALVLDTGQLGVSACVDAIVERLESIGA